MHGNKKLLTPCISDEALYNKNMKWILLLIVGLLVLSALYIMGAEKEEAKWKEIEDAAKARHAPEVQDTSNEYPPTDL